MPAQLGSCAGIAVSANTGHTTRAAGGRPGPGAGTRPPTGISAAHTPAYAPPPQTRTQGAT